MNVDEQTHAEVQVPQEAPRPALPAISEPRPPAEEVRKRTRPGSIANIVQAIAAITREVGIVPKAGYNAFHRYKFAQMQDVLQRLTPVMSRHGLVVIQTEIGRSMFDDERVIAIQYEFTIAHVSGEMWPDRPKQTGVCRCRDSKGGYDDKAINKCHTAARKYFLLALFQIATGEEGDADADDGPPPRRAPPAPGPNVIQQPGYKLSTGAPPYDPETGEVKEDDDTSQTRPSPAGPAAPVDIPPGAAGSPLTDKAKNSIQVMAREAAKMGGREQLNVYFKTLPPEGKRIITLMQAELEQILGPKEQPA